MLKCWGLRFQHLFLGDTVQLQPWARFEGTPNIHVREGVGGVGGVWMLLMKSNWSVPPAQGRDRKIAGTALADTGPSVPGSSAFSPAPFAPCEISWHLSPLCRADSPAKQENKMAQSSCLVWFFLNKPRALKCPGHPGGQVRSWQWPVSWPFLTSSLHSYHFLTFKFPPALLARSWPEIPGCLALQSMSQAPRTHLSFFND